MVDEIYEYIPNLHGNHTLCYFMNDSKSVSNHNATVTDVLFVKRLEYKKTTY